VERGGKPQLRVLVAVLKQLWKPVDLTLALIPTFFPGEGESFADSLEIL